LTSSSCDDEFLKNDTISSGFIPMGGSSNSTTIIPSYNFEKISKDSITLEKESAAFLSNPKPASGAVVARPVTQ
jgi:hypothetical protein